MENQTDKQIEKEENKAMADRLEALAARIEAANAETARLNAQQAVGGESEAGAKAPEPVKLTDIEYAELLMKGKANPLLDDGYL